MRWAVDRVLMVTLQHPSSSFSFHPLSHQDRSTASVSLLQKLNLCISKKLSPFHHLKYSYRYKLIKLSLFSCLVLSLVCKLSETVGLGLSITLVIFAQSFLVSPKAIRHSSRALAILVELYTLTVLYLEEMWAREWASMTRDGLFWKICYNRNRN
jgi:hypothetical protein